MIKLKRVNLFSFILALIFLFDTYVIYGADRKKDIDNYNVSIKKQQDSLEDINLKLRKKEKEFKKTKTKRQNLSKELGKVDRKLSKTAKTLKKLGKDIKKMEAKQKSTQKKLSVCEGDLVGYKKNLGNELNVVYKEKLTAVLSEVLTEDKSYGYSLRTNKAMEVLIRHDYESLVRTQEEIDNLAGLKQDIDKRKKKIKSLKNTTYANKRKYTKDKKKKAKLLKTTKQKQVEQEKEISRLKESSQELEKLITELKYKLSEVQKKRLKKFGLVKQKGNLIWPVAGEVVSLFGKYKHPELKTYLFNNGIEIKTQKKAEVLAVEEGSVLFASDFKSYGKTVIIEHSRNFCTVYSHLGEIKVNNGDYINKKEIIGTINSLLYFEIRLENKPEDPLLWLTSDH